MKKNNETGKRVLPAGFRPILAALAITAGLSGCNTIFIEDVAPSDDSVSDAGPNGSDAAASPDASASDAAMPDAAIPDAAVPNDAAASGDAGALTDAGTDAGPMCFTSRTKIPTVSTNSTPRRSR